MKNKDLPVIIKSSVEDQPGLVATMEDIGFESWPSKPINPDEAAKMIRKSLEHNP